MSAGQGTHQHVLEHVQSAQHSSSQSTQSREHSTFSTHAHECMGLKPGNKPTDSREHQRDGGAGWHNASVNERDACSGRMQQYRGQFCWRGRCACAYGLFFLTWEPFLMIKNHLLQGRRLRKQKQKKLNSLRHSVSAFIALLRGCAHQPSALHPTSQRCCNFIVIWARPTV